MRDASWALRDVWKSVTGYRVNVGQVTGPLPVVGDCFFLTLVLKRDTDVGAELARMERINRCGGVIFLYVFLQVTKKL